MENSTERSKQIANDTMKRVLIESKQFAKDTIKETVKETATSAIKTTGIYIISIIIVALTGIGILSYLISKWF